LTDLRLALLLGTEYFEGFYGRQLGLSVAEYLESYRNDWSWDYARMLRARGIEPLIYVASSTQSGRYETSDGFSVRFVPLSAAYRPYLRFPMLKRSPPARYLSQVVNGGALLPSLRAGLRADRVDVLMVQEYWTGRFDVLMAGISLPRLTIDQGLPDRREVKALKRWSMPRVYRVITQTDWERRKVARYGGVAERIPNAVDAELFNLPEGDGHREEHLVLITARLLDVQKRISDLIRAVSHLPAPWRLRVLGNGPDERKLRDLAASLGVEHRVEFAGFVADKAAIIRELHRCTVFALPSAYEGLPMSLLEAMSTGAAVVASKIPAVAEVVTDGDDGLLHPVGDAKRIADLVVQAALKRDTLGRGARRKIVESYSQTVVGGRVETLVRGAVLEGAAAKVP
jgi:glycosyltransferase involved in cell wall biosynthesis